MIAYKKDLNIPIKYLFSLFSILFILHRLTTTVADTDLWGYMSFGRLFWTSNGFPYSDVFSYVPTLNVWVYHEWLTGLFFYSIYETFSFPGLQVLKYGLGFFTLVLVYLTSRQRGSSPLSAGLAVLAIVGLLRMGYSPVRAQIFTYCFFSLTFFLLEKSRITYQWRILWVLIPILTLWCNLHGGFVAGLGLIGLYALGEMISGRSSFNYWIILLFSALATIINPYGFEYWKYMFEAVAMPRPMISEWASVLTSFQAGNEKGIIVYFVVLNLFALIWMIRKQELTGGLVLAITMFLGWRHLRHIPFFTLIFGVFFADLISGYIIDFKVRFKHFSSRLVPIVTITGLGISLIFLSYDTLRQDPFTLKTPPNPGIEKETTVYYPMGAIEYIRKNNLSGNLLTHFDWGEYAMWALYPRCKVALDGRFEAVYSSDVFKSYFSFLFGEDNWEEFIDKYPPDFILIEASSRVTSFIRNDLRWEQIYVDSGCILFKRNLLSSMRQDS